MRWKIEKQKIKCWFFGESINKMYKPLVSLIKKKAITADIRSRNDKGSNSVINQKSQLGPSQGLNRSIEIFSKHLRKALGTDYFTGKSQKALNTKQSQFFFYKLL